MKNLRKSVLSFNHIRSGEWTQIVRSGKKCLYLLSHFFGGFIKYFEFVKKIHGTADIVWTFMCGDDKNLILF